MSNKEPEWELGRQVGMIEGSIREQERIIKLLESTELTTINPETQEVQLIEMDWGNLFNEIRNPEED